MVFDEAGINHVRLVPRTANALSVEASDHRDEREAGTVRPPRPPSHSRAAATRAGSSGKSKPGPGGRPHTTRVGPVNAQQTACSVLAPTSSCGFGGRNQDEEELLVILILGSRRILSCRGWGGG